MKESVATLESNIIHNSKCVQITFKTKCMYKPWQDRRVGAVDEKEKKDTSLDIKTLGI